MRLIQKVLLSVVALGGASWVNACSIGGLEHEVIFEKNSGLLPTSQVLFLTNWYVSRRDSSHGIEDVVLFAYASKGDKGAVSVARERAAAVRGVITTLAVVDAIPPVIRIKELDKPPLDPLAYDEVIVAIQPKCAKTHSCCPEPTK